MGLNPFAVAITGFVGNWIPVLLIVLFFKELSAWRARRGDRKRVKQAPEGDSIHSHSEHNGTQDDQPSKKHVRARKVWEKYGVPGYSLLAPILIGTDIATILALAFGSPRRPITIWMTISLVVWSTVLAFLAKQGINFIQ